MALLLPMLWLYSLLWLLLLLVIRLLIPVADDKTRAATEKVVVSQSSRHGDDDGCDGNDAGVVGGNGDEGNIGEDKGGGGCDIDGNYGDRVIVSCS